MVQWVDMEDKGYASNGSSSVLRRSLWHHLLHDTAGDPSEQERKEIDWAACFDDFPGSSAMLDVTVVVVLGEGDGSLEDSR